MIGREVKFQLTLFGDIASLLPTPNIIKQCVDIFMPLGMFPGHSQEIDFSASEPLKIDRLALHSIESGTTVNFLSNRVDIYKEFDVPEGQVLGGVSEFFSCAKIIVDLAAESFDLKFHRAGMVFDIIFPPMELNKIEEIRKDVLPGLVSLYGTQQVDWNFSTVERGVIGDLSGEQVNFGQTLVKVKAAFQNESLEFDSIRVLLDINSIPENNTPRFGPVHLDGFIKDGLESYKKYGAAIKETINAYE